MGASLLAMAKYIYGMYNLTYIKRPGLSPTFQIAGLIQQVGGKSNS